MKLPIVVAALALLFPAAASAQSSTAAIDAEVWSAVAASVANADIKAMAATYHPDAVVVTPGSTVLASEQLPKWGKDMEDARPRKQTATVEFRFSKRLDNAATAFEVGMFTYTVTDSAGRSTAYHIPLEALLVRSNGRWLLLMERQFAAGTTEDWNALPR